MTNRETHDKAVGIVVSILREKGFDASAPGEGEELTVLVHGRRGRIFHRVVEVRAGTVWPEGPHYRAAKEPPASEEYFVATVWLAHRETPGFRLLTNSEARRAWTDNPPRYLTADLPHLDTDGQCFERLDPEETM
jgi:hypothetical protein